MKINLLKLFSKKKTRIVAKGLTTSVFEHLADYENIQYLYPIIRFINHLMQKYNHRIKRNDAKIKTRSDCLKK